MNNQEASDWLVAHPQVHIQWSEPLRGTGEHTGWFWFVKNNEFYADGVKSTASIYNLFPVLVRLAKDTLELVETEANKKPTEGG